MSFELSNIIESNIPTFPNFKDPQFTKIVKTRFVSKRTAMLQCPTLGSIRTSVPDVIWNATNPDPNMTLPVGSTLNFKCPDGLQVKVYAYLIKTKLNKRMTMAIYVIIDDKRHQK